VINNLFIFIGEIVEARKDSARTDTGTRTRISSEQTDAKNRQT